ncbi:molybdate transport system substrate-binding protein [Desulfocicer vacuolatum DSM 3385]|uniref:Molybdate transport system substrate-binding protein n=1 Tax=Desulfocicer vacuolatum DSM 3385 TaxID=1121400 RepID=A0A1W1YP08_9BACT|nr:substrate-binding domain-containing protein [Desulfocicer vacuolatum]SMC37873.1 molybdate transport system substrate-binding protein [Desulfocicer vacuolatum DSM 3385]
MKKITALFLLFCGIILPACPSEKPPTPTPTMLIFCGITMIKPMMDIAEIIESKENINILITKGGSGNLLKSIVFNQKGDLYLPGSERYYQTIKTDHPGLIVDQVPVGKNRAAIMVQKGNPRQISSDLENFTRSEYAVIIGNATSGSIGKETRNIFTNKGIYEKVLANTMHLTTDSKDLARALREKKADMVINWYAVSTWEENAKFMDTIDIDPRHAKPKSLILGLLKFSKHPEIARKFMALAASPQGRAIFKKYGLHF